MTPEAILTLLGTCSAMLLGVALYLVVSNRQSVERERAAAADRARTLLDEAKLAAADIRENQNRRESALDARDAQLAELTSTVQAREAEVNARLADADAEFHRIVNLTESEARDIYLARIEDEFRDLAARRAKEIEQEAMRDTDRRAKKALVDAIQRSAVPYVTEASQALVELESEDIKGRIIGREGRNIRSFEQVTGVDLIVDETPGAVVISSFDPVRREIARLTLMNLIGDGRIHPGRIEEAYGQAQREVETVIQEAGIEAASRANVVGLSEDAIAAMGRLRFRTSYAQNVLDHSVEVARLAENLAHELGLNADIAKRAGFLHDIGKSLPPEWEGPHALAGMAFLQRQGERSDVLNAVGAHHNEIEPASAEAILVIIADSVSAARPGARRENLENYMKRLTALEAMAAEMPGVDRAYAIQAGREVRLIVRPDTVTDLAARRLASQLARRIEKEMEYPGQIKVTVVREFRVSAIAK